ncbi:MAG: FMN-binding protein, partial [Coriobacteriia bacterium]|nr:FMN-binding protein [Coriobacteriia bacterium]
MDRTMFRNVAMSAVLVAGLGLGGVALVNAPATSATASEAASAAADGTYEGTGKGIGGNVPVTVTVEGGKITAVEVGENSETQGIGTKAIEQLPAKIVEANGVEGVDAISGATVT